MSCECWGRKLFPRSRHPPENISGSYEWEGFITARLWIYWTWDVGCLFHAILAVAVLVLLSSSFIFCSLLSVCHCGVILRWFQVTAFCCGTGGSGNGYCIRLWYWWWWWQVLHSAVVLVVVVTGTAFLCGIDGGGDVFKLLHSACCWWRWWWFRVSVFRCGTDGGSDGYCIPLW